MFYGQDISLSRALMIAVAGFAVVFFALILLAFLVRLLSAAVRAGEKIAAGNKSVEAMPVLAEETNAPQVAAGELKLIDTDEAEAAAIMAIVSHQSGIPLNRLQFRSIRLLPETR